MSEPESLEIGVAQSSGNFFHRCYYGPFVSFFRRVAIDFLKLLQIP